MSEFTIGFANQDEKNLFAVAVRQALEAEVAQHPDLRLIVRDNDLDTEKAIANAHEFAEVPVDLAIIFHIDERAGMEITAPLRLKRIPIIAIDIPMPLTSFFGINNREAGQVAGAALAEWIAAAWGARIDRVLIVTESRTLDVVRQRLDSALETLRSRVPFLSDQVLSIDGGGTPELTRARVRLTLENWPDLQHIAVLCLNDKVAVGALEGARDLGREEHVAVLSYDGTEIALAEFEKPHSRLIVSPSFQPAQYGARLVDLALRLRSGERLPIWNYVEPFHLTRASYRAERGLSD